MGNHVPKFHAAYPILKDERQCAECREFTTRVEEELPHGWRYVAGKVICPSCAPSVIAAIERRSDWSEVEGRRRAQPRRRAGL